VASGVAVRSNNRRSGALPRRWRAGRNADGLGTCQARSQAEPNRSPPTILRITSSYASPKNNANAIT
jgi:hypothetical protein